MIKNDQIEHTVKRVYIYKWGIKTISITLEQTEWILE